MVIKKLYMAYGSNMNQERMMERCPTAKILGSAILKSYRLLFRGENAGAVATIEKQDGGILPVVIWEITPSDEIALDRYEGFPFLYRKEYIKLKFGGKQIEALVYILNDGRPLGLPSRYYYEIIKKGYETVKLDIKILNSAVQVSSKKEPANDK